MNDNYLKKDQSYSNQDIKDDWNNADNADNADNDWQKNKLIKKCFFNL